MLVSFDGRSEVEGEFLLLAPNELEEVFFWRAEESKEILGRFVFSPPPEDDVEGLAV